MILHMAKHNDIVAKAYAKRDKEIVRLHKANWTLREIGVLFDLSHERVRQIIEKLENGVSA